MESRVLAGLRALQVDPTTAELDALAGAAEAPERSWSRRSALAWA